MRYTGRRNLDGRVIWEGVVLSDSDRAGTTGGWFDMAGNQGLIFTFEGMQPGDEVYIHYSNSSKAPITPGIPFRNAPFKEDGEYKPKQTARWVKVDHHEASGSKIRVHIYGL